MLVNATYIGSNSQLTKGKTYNFDLNTFEDNEFMFGLELDDNSTINYQDLKSFLSSWNKISLLNTLGKQDIKIKCDLPGNYHIWEKWRVIERADITRLNSKVGKCLYQERICQECGKLELNLQKATL